jgi:hypothetical protein
MFISSESQNCFRVLEAAENSGEFAKMIQRMRERGMKVEVLEDDDDVKRFRFH